MIIFTFAAAWLAKALAWALPFLGPVRLAVRLWRAKAAERLPAGLGSTVLGLAVAVALVWVAYRQVDAWLNPPPPTYTAVEVELAQSRAEIASLKEAVEAQSHVLRTRQRLESSLAKIIEETQTELDNEKRNSATPRPALYADDPWLRGWERRGW